MSRCVFICNLKPFFSWVASRVRLPKRLSKLSVFIAGIMLCVNLPSLPAQGEGFFHIVTEDARSLTEISLYLYGKSSYFQELAEWNHLSSPDSIRLGQKLILKVPPTLNPQEGAQTLLAHWRKKFGILDSVKEAIKTEIQKKVEVKKKFEEAAPLVLKDAEFEPSSAQEFFTEGKKSFDLAEYEKALSGFRKSREAEPDFLPPWFFEIRALRALNRKEEEEQIKATFLSKHPQFKGLPFFRGVPAREPSQERTSP